MVDTFQRVASAMLVWACVHKLDLEYHLVWTCSSFFRPFPTLGACNQYINWLSSYLLHKPGHLVQHEISYKLNLSKMITYTQLQMISQEQHGCHKHRPQPTHMQDTHQKLITQASRGKSLLFLQKETAFRPNNADGRLLMSPHKLYGSVFFQDQGSQLPIDFPLNFIWSHFGPKRHLNLDNFLL